MYLHESTERAAEINFYGWNSSLSLPNNVESYNCIRCFIEFCNEYRIFFKKTTCSNVLMEDFFNNSLSRMFFSEKLRERERVRHVMYDEACFIVGN